MYQRPANRARLTQVLIRVLIRGALCAGVDARVSALEEFDPLREESARNADKLVRKGVSNILTAAVPRCAADKMSPDDRLRIVCSLKLVF
ncbi:hypothetical protein FB451DRAFT_1212237 [Mycena latifolia]|nr:hypothetical protein FB451DRAFT_1212237 [Mycena latifolia]